jgi:hypothetical protein
MVAPNATRPATHLALHLHGGLGFRLRYFLALSSGDDGKHQLQLIEKHLRHTLRITV